MTESEFKKQIWRFYDLVELQNGGVYSVLNVCFPTRSVRVSIDQNVMEWVKCSDIVSHIGKSTGDGTLEGELMQQISEKDAKMQAHKKIISAKDRKIESLKTELARQQKDCLKQLKNSVNQLKSKIAQVEGIKVVLDRVEDIVERIEMERSEEEN